MPKTLLQAIGQPPIIEVMKVTGNAPIVRYIEFELVTMASRISVGGNLTNAMVEFIAKQLIELFPNESLADFKLCFERGSIGQYGEIYRMDGIVLRGWMEKYLEEKYQVLEDKLVNEKESFTYNQPAQTLTDEAKQQQIKDRLQRWHDAIIGTEEKKISPLTDLEVRQEGHERPKAMKYRSTTLADINEHEKRIKTARQKYFREIYPDASDEEIDALALTR